MSVVHLPLESSGGFVGGVRCKSPCSCEDVVSIPVIVFFVEDVHILEQILPAVRGRVRTMTGVDLNFTVDTDPRRTS